ncbi:pyrroline-5-carboxylate reductase [Epithele typhae]|uniref:pyrroline-5-carboxylate reductase n=1 Tax=Epithele typhae TaxID=378194 RepID=UPI00200893B7|nr:pyrroline-5-carboxylate reductase [Epithele typhae]KAH9946060.1 pyrroline-5-carboxylate reductase [Epithele typhae]
MGYTLCILGCGTMGVAILSGVLASLDAKPASPHPKWESHTSGTVTPQVLEDDALPSRFIACKLAGAFFSAGTLGRSVEIFQGRNVAAVREADVVLLCCKPQLAQTILAEPGMQDAFDGKLLLSILAGVTIAQLRAMVLPSTRVARTMPNTASKIREGMTVEKHFDACTALSGSGPAFACIFLEAMADGGVMMGLPRAEALELAAQTLQGAARMTLAGTHPAVLKDAVTTPGGCTIAGLLAMEDGRVRSTIARAIQVATERASELGQPGKK